MRVRWFTNDPLPAVNRRTGRLTRGTGHWMPCLLEHLSRRPDLQLEIATTYQGMADDQFEENGVRYFVLGQIKYQPFYSCWKRDLDKARTLVGERAPDLVHIHGTERFYGLLPARKLIQTPCAISLQGLLEPYIAGFFGALSPLDIWRSDRLIEIATRRGLLWGYRDLRCGARREREILASDIALMGRTDWDRAHVMSVNPAARYHHVGEILRPEFKQDSWDVNRCERHTIIFTNAGAPRRGTETLLRALGIVRRQYPDAKILLSGVIGNRRGYERFLRRAIAGSGLAGSIEFLGYLEAAEMTKALCRAHVFAISSFIENSPNSLCEAMQVGLPCVATYAGGIPSLVEHDRTGLLFPLGDASLLADAILRIFRDDDLASRLGRAARAEASDRHAPQKVVSQLLNVYGSVASGRQDTNQAVAVCQA